MARQPKIFWKSSHNCFYANIQGKQTRLDPDEDRALEIFYSLMADRDMVDDPPVVKVLGEFLEHHRRHSAPRTVEFYRLAIDSFSDWLKGKRLTISALKPAHVTDWLKDRHSFKWRQVKKPEKGQAKWQLTDKPISDNHKHNLIRSIKAAMAWHASEQELLRVPLKGLKKPAQTARKLTLSDEQFQKLLKASFGEFRDVLTVLRHTGCRVQELRAVEARHVEGKKWVFPPEEAKAGKKTGRPRTVHLSDAAHSITMRLVGKYPTGPLFRNVRGRPWTRSALDRRMRSIAKNLGIKMCLYDIRHLFATAAIEGRQVDLISLARVMGHADLKMLSKIYVQLDDKHNAETLRKALGDVA